jgi:DMSO/TMAO reductase YedYZ molybdopterin-dependent catalytic subunit
MVLESDIVLVVDGAVEHNLELSFADLAQFQHQSLRATDELGKESLFEGVLVAEILKAAGVKFGKELRGKKLADYLLVETADGYRVVFALPEFDPSFFKDTLVLLADRRDGNPLGESDGQLRLIIPHEKRYARWGRHVVALHVKHS